MKRKVKRNLPLIYLDEPKEVIGVTKVYNANEIEVDGTYIFLYGIYVNPETELGLEAKKFLENVVKNQVVRVSGYCNRNVLCGRRKHQPDAGNSQVFKKRGVVKTVLIKRKCSDVAAGFND